MDPENTAVDIPVDNPHVEEDVSLQKGHFGVNSKYFIEAAGLLTIWSLLVINEGAIRFAGLPTATSLAGGRPANGALFAAALMEIIFGLIGLAIGASALVTKWFNANVMYAAMGLQTVMGIYVFLMYVFIQPIYRSIDIGEATVAPPLRPGFSDSENRALIAMGILTSFNWCLALQGGQFVFLARLAVGGTGKNILMQKTGNFMRAIFWNANLALSGLWTIITGAVVIAQIGGGKLEIPFIFPPNVGVLPGLTIFTGILVMLWGLAGIGFAAGKMKAPAGYYYGSFIVYLFSYLNYTIVQFGLLDETPVGPVSMHGGLVFMVTMLGPYFVHQANKEIHGE